MILNRATPDAEAGLILAASTAKKTPVKKVKKETEDDGTMTGTPISKKRCTTDGENGDDEESPKKRRAKVAMPKSQDEFSDADKLLVKLRKEGKTWSEIAKALAGQNRELPPRQSMQNRCRGLMAIIVDWDDGDVSV